MLKQHLHICCIYYDDQGPHIYQLEYSDSAISKTPIYKKKQYVEGDRRPSVMVQGGQQYDMGIARMSEYLCDIVIPTRSALKLR